MGRTVLLRTSTGFVALLAALALLGVTAPPAAASAIRPAGETRMVNKINSSRAAYGLPPLRENLQMVRLARQWARSMARLNRVYHRPDLADAVDGDYVRLSENVGFLRLEGGSDRTIVDLLHRAFMNSDGHRAQILGRFNQVGVGLYRASGGRMFVAVNFIQGPLDGFPLYRDSERSAHRAAIGRLFRRGAVKGCTSNRFCPGATGTRVYLAAAIDRAAHIRTATNYVNASCSTSYACRSADMTRGEMAVILAQSLRLAPVSGNEFSDVGAADREMINAVVAAGIMTGCGSGRFCPGREVSRGSIATVVYRVVLR